MKTMQDYELRCTAEQTRRAYELGAPLEEQCIGNNNVDLDSISVSNGYGGSIYLIIPTTQQMMGWLREQGVNAYAAFEGVNMYLPICFVGDSVYQEDIAQYLIYKKPEQAELAAIDAALDYLEKGGTK